MSQRRHSSIKAIIGLIAGYSVYVIPMHAVPLIGDHYFNFVTIFLYENKFIYNYTPLFKIANKIWQHISVIVSMISSYVGVTLNMWYYLEVYEQNMQRYSHWMIDFSILWVSYQFILAVVDGMVAYI